MFRLEPDARFHCQEQSKPDPAHRGFSIVQRTYYLATGSGPDVPLSPGFGEAIAAGQADHPQPLGQADDRFWWAFEGSVYSTPDRLSRAAVTRLARRASAEQDVRTTRRRATESDSWSGSAVGA